MGPELSASANNDRTAWPGAAALGSQARVSAFEALKAMPETFLVAAVLLVLLASGRKLLGGSLPLRSGALPVLVPHLSGTLKLSVISALALLEYIVLACVAVAVHRFVLLNKSSSLLTALRHRYGWRFLLWMFGFTFCELLLALPVLLQRWLGFALLVPMIILSTRVSLVFPAVAIEAPLSGWRERLVWSWQQTQGKVLSLTGAWILAELPLVVIMVVILLSLFGVDLIAGTFLMDDARMDVFCSAFENLAATVLLASVLSVSYRAVRSFEGAPTP